MYYPAAMVCEGGALLGVYTAGVLDVLMQKHIYTTYGIGVSVGSCNIVDYSSRQIGRTFKCLNTSDEETIFFGKPAIRRTGHFYDLEMCMQGFADRYVPFYYNDFAASPMKTECVATDIETGKPRYIECRAENHQVMDACRASASMPFLCPPYELDGHKYLDGSVSKSIPIQRAMSYGTDKIVVITTKPAGYRMKPPTPSYRTAARLRYGKHPALVNAMLNRWRVYNDDLAYIETLADAGKIFLFRPTWTVRHLEKDHEKMQASYEEGRRQAEERASALVRYLEK
ncbi:MAG: patatin family protein [Oscillospiraceae bacterium]|nr:patatin family protein [Oscillospiraceae bacterium]